MKTTRLGIAAAILSSLCAATYTACGVTTNTVPWSASFESYTNGMSISGTNGWAADRAEGALISTDKAVTDLLTNYPGVFPLPSLTHTGVLNLATLVSNTVSSASNGVVLLDVMAMPDWMPNMPIGDTDTKFYICVSTNGRLTIWHHNTVVSPATNQWLELAGSPVIPSNAWARFTILQDNSNRLFQVRVNEGAPISDAAGWTAGGVLQNGPWFHMVQTNPVMSQLIAAGASAYLDDVVIGKRALTWSRTDVTENTINHGAIDNTSPLTLSLAVDSFEGVVGADLVAGGTMIVGGLPSGLFAVATLTNSTTVSLTITGVAPTHEAVNSGLLSVQFANAAFTLGNAADVSGSQTNIGLTFLDTPILSYNTNHFQEAAANDGSIENGSPLLITLANGAFNGADHEDIGGNPAKLQVAHLPMGLTLEALLVSSTQLQVRLLGQATLSDASNDVADLTLTFADDAFSVVPASSVFNASAVFSLSFRDSSVLTYAATVFTEMAANDGSVNGTTVTLVNKSFNAVSGEDLVVAGKVTCQHLPGGLTLHITRGLTDQEATLTFTGTALVHASVDSVSNLQITFLDNAFAGGAASSVLNYNQSTLHVQFADPRILGYSAGGFVELSAGQIDNRSPVTITMSGDALTGTNGENFVASGKISATHIPPGLTAQITRDSDTRLSIRLSGVAADHASGNSVGNVAFTFQDGAFLAGNAAYVVNYATSGMSVTFRDEVGFYNVVPYVEPFESYLNGTLLAGSNGWSAPNYADACMVTNDSAMTGKLGEYQKSHMLFPFSGTHTQTLFVQDSIEAAIDSESAGLVNLDLMMFPVPMQAVPVADTDMQFALYVSTNCQLVIWHCDMTGGSPANQWLTLASAPLIDTSTWVRLTVTQDYTNNMFQIRVNEGEPISDAAGWSMPNGGGRPGSWFHMVQTNGSMKSFFLSGVGAGYLDDVTVRFQLPACFGQGIGTVYIFH